MFKKYHGKLYCFSPPVMLATLLIEFGFAAYTLWRYKMSTVRKLAFATLVALGTFQLAEYMVCGGLGWTNVEWARVGYGAITLLPAIGIHMVATLANKKAPILVGTAYVSCLAFVVFYLIGESAVSAHTCTANYAVFDTIRASVWPFATYYYGWLLVGALLAWQWGRQIPKRQNALHAMVIGYAAFILPTTAFNIIDPSTTRGIPSIMCGFAVIFAFVLIIKVLPNSCEVSPLAQDLQNKLQTIR
jgi:hypothetical protein